MDNYYLEEEIKEVNRTYRGGPFAKNRIVPKVVELYAKPESEILDYGAGKGMIQAKKLIKKGFKVTAYDFGDNVTKEHDRKALDRKYDIVYASNVLNVQPNTRTLNVTLKEIEGAVKKGGLAIVNYPKKPRKVKDITREDMDKKIMELFPGSIFIKALDVWVCVRLKNVESTQKNS